MKEDEVSKQLGEIKDTLVVLAFFSVAIIVLLLGLIFIEPGWSKSKAEPKPVLCWDKGGYVYDCEPVGGK